MSTPTPRTDERINGAPCTRFGILAGDSLRGALVPSEFARTLERELHESRNAERLARVQLGNERARLDDLISVNATGAARLAHAAVQLAAEREKVRVLRLACERIVEQWDKNHDAAPFHAGNVMYSRASAALAATEDAQ
jgi:hypothetical protein